MARTLIVGAGGRLGAALAREWQASGEDLLAFSRADLDLADAGKLRGTLAPVDFDVLVNCAAQTNVDRCETHPDEAFAINADAVRVLAEVCSQKKARCVHISTDYVFDGNKETPYTEEDQPNPISRYGASKLGGEIALLEVDPGHLAVRVSWVFGPDRPSFVDQIIQRARSSETVEAIGDKWAVPTYTQDVAALLRPLLRDKAACGLVHLCNEGACTWQEYGQFALDCAAASGVALQSREVGALRMADLQAFIARRPRYTVMAVERLIALTGLTPRSWRDAVREYVERFVSRRD